MNCRDMEKTLSAYLDGELPSERRAAVAAHLRSCGSCSARVAEWEAVWTLLGALPEAKPAPHFRARLLARLHEPHLASYAEFLERILIPVSTAAVALLGFWIGYVAGGNGDASASPNEATSPLVSTAYLDTFDPVPTASLGDVYFAVNDVLNGEGTP